MGPELNIPSPIMRVDNQMFAVEKLQLLIKREDLIDPFLSGNKWRKLKYNLRQAKTEGKNTLVTFGGAFSNHLFATAAAGRRWGFKTIGLVRGEATDSLNPTLAFAQSCGMELQFVSRTAYREKEKVLADLRLNLPDVYILPEGGTNKLALQGCTEIAAEIRQQCDAVPDYICLCCGTGGTMAGLTAGLAGESQVLGFSVLKGGFLQAEVVDWLKVYQKEFGSDSFEMPQNWQIQDDFHFGGYARFDASLIDLINRYNRDFEIPLDPIYTGKMFYGLETMAQNGYFSKGSTILAIHTGGLQGVAGFNQRFGNLIQ